MKKQKHIHDAERLVASLGYVQPKKLTLKRVQELFSPPVTNSNAPSMAQDSSLDGLYSTIYSSLVQHSFDEGQMPIQGFMGYGALQQIAQNSLIRACVNTIADEATREWITLKGGDSDSDGEVDEAENEKIGLLEDLVNNKYQLKKLFNKVMSLVGYNGGAFIFIDTGVEDPSVPLIVSQFSGEFDTDRELRFIAIDPVNCSPADVNQYDPLKPDFMAPRAWWVLGKRVDASRLIRFVENEPPTILKPAYNYLGIPRAQLLWDYVMHFNKARHTTVSLLEKLNLTVFKTNVADLLSTAGGLEELDARIGGLARYRNNDSVLVADQEGETVENITLSTQGATDVARQALEFVACVNRTPVVKLLGISPSGFNATGAADTQNFYDHLRSVQSLYTDGLALCLKAIQLAEFGEIDGSISFDWNELGTEDEAAKNQAAMSKSQTLLGLQGSNVLSAEEVREAIRKDPSFGLEFIGEELPEPEQEEGQGGLEILLNGLKGQNNEGNPSESATKALPSEEKGFNDLLNELKQGSENEYADENDSSDRT